MTQVQEGDEVDVVAASRSLPDPSDSLRSELPPPPPPHGRSRALGQRLVWYWPLVIVAAVAIGVRLFAMAGPFALCPPVPPGTQAVPPPPVEASLNDCFSLGGDALYYESQGAQIANGTGFGGLLGAPSAQHPPAMSLWVAAQDRAGLTTTEQHRWTSVMLGTLGSVLVGLLGCRVAGERRRWVGLVAGLFAATYPSFITNDARLRAETLFMPLAAGALLLMYRFWQRPSWPNTVCLGAGIGALWLTRPEAILFSVVLAPLMVLFLRSVPIKQRLIMAGLIGVIPMMMMAPWTLYNRGRFERPPLITNTDGVGMLLNSCDSAFYESLYQSYSCITSLPPVEGGDESVNNQRAREVATAYLQEHKSDIPLVAWIRVRRIWGVYSYDNAVAIDAYLEGYSSWASATTIGYYLTLPFAVVGVWVLRSRKRPLIPLLVPFAVVTISVVLLGAVTRFRTAADISLVVLAAVGFVTSCELLWRRFGARVMELVERWPLLSGKTRV